MDPFFIKDCTLAVIATGESATSLVELQQHLEKVSSSCIYYHFWGERLRPSFVHSEYMNDFARWSHRCLHDNILAERLAIIDPTDYKTLEALRQAVLDIIEKRIDESEYSLWLKKQTRFHFLRSIVIVFDTPLSFSHPRELKVVLPQLSTNAIYYHFIDARTRTPGNVDDFSFWLGGYKDEFKDLILRIQHVDPYFFTLTEIKQKLIDVVNDYFKD